MKTAIISVPMMKPEKVKRFNYSADGNKEIEYDKEIMCPVHAVLAKTLKKNEELKVIYILTTGRNSSFKENVTNFKAELEEINSDIGADIHYETIEIEFKPTKATLQKILTELAAKIPNNAEIYADITFGYKPAIISLFCAIKFAEEFREALIQYIVYGKVEFLDEKDNKGEPVLFDISSLYYLFNLMGSMRTADADAATKMLEDFFSI